MTVDADFTELPTERLRLRRFQPEDAEIFATYRMDPDVARYQSWETYSPYHARRFIEEIASVSPGMPGEWFQFAVTEPDTDRLIGDVALRVLPDDSGRAELGFTFAPEHQGKGYATEAVRALLAYAFDRLDVDAVFAIADTRNGASIAVLERVEMRRIATERARFKGEWCDEHTYERERARS